MINVRLKLVFDVNDRREIRKCFQIVPNFYIQRYQETQKENCYKTTSFSVFYISNGKKLILQSINDQYQDLEQVLLYTNAESVIKKVIALF